MKKLLLLLTLFTFSANPVLAEHSHPASAPGSSELEKLKTLEGKWEGTTTTEGKIEPAAVTYHVTAGGSTVVETLFPGTPHEMVSMYHDEDGKLTMTHYCMLGNQPKFAVDKSSPSDLKLSFAKDNAGKTATEDHMHSLHMAFVDSDTLVNEWTPVLKGKSGQTTVLNLKRTK